MKEKRPRRVSIIGSGVGGLATAIRLASRGYEVDVFEKNPRPGGKLGLLERDGYVFDTGPSLFTQPSNIEELFRIAGEPIDGYFKYARVGLCCRYFYENGKRVDAHARREDFARALAETVGEDPSAVVSYLEEAERSYEALGRIFLERSLHRASTWTEGGVLRALRQVGIGHLFRSLDAFNRSRLRTPEAVQLFNRYATYNGSNPFRAPGMLSLIPHLEHNEGTFYPEGGMIAIVNALHRLAERKGVRFHFGARVRRILQGDNGVRGVEAEGVPCAADFVVSNVDVYFTYRDLLGDEAAARRVLRRERSSSALIFYWGMRQPFPELHLHNIFFSTDYRREFEALFNGGPLYHDPTVYVNITSKMEQGFAPGDGENWFVMLNAPAGGADMPPEAIAEARRNTVAKLSRLLGKDVGAAIATEDVLTPGGIERNTDSYMGSLYGTSSNSPWAAFLRHPNFTGRYRGLYFTGGSVHPGGGIPLCLKSAAIVDSLLPPAG